MSTSEPPSGAISMDKGHNIFPSGPLPVKLMLQCVRLLRLVLKGIFTLGNRKKNSSQQHASRKMYEHFNSMLLLQYGQISALFKSSCAN